MSCQRLSTSQRSSPSRTEGVLAKRVTTSSPNELPFHDTAVTRPLSAPRSTAATVRLISWSVLLWRGGRNRRSEPDVPAEMHRDAELAEHRGLDQQRPVGRGGVRSVRHVCVI